MKPSKLSFRKMWELYKTLQSGIKNQENYLIDEVLEILDGISKEQFLQAIWIMYPQIDFRNHNPGEMASLFIAGLKRNNFFQFAETIQGMKRDNPK